MTLQQFSLIFTLLSINVPSLCQIFYKSEKKFKELLLESKFILDQIFVQTAMGLHSSSLVL